MYNSVKFGVFILLACVWIIPTEQWRPFKIAIKNVTVASFGDLTSLNISLSPTGALSAKVLVLDTINQPYVHAEVFADSGKGNFDFEITNKTVDICKLFVKKNYEPLIQLFYKVLLESGPWPRRCPIRKTAIIIDNWIVNTDNLPPYLPEKKLFINLRFTNKKNSIIQDMNIVTFYFALESS